MLISEAHTWSPSAFEAAVEGVAGELRTLPNDKIAFFARTDPATIFLFFALWKLGKIACPLNPKEPSPETCAKKLGALFWTPRLAAPRSPTAWHWRETQIATHLFTSGTGAAPKIAIHTLGNHLYSALGSQEVIPLGPGSRWLASLPLFHIGGIAILFRTYLARAAIVLPPLFEAATHISLVPTQLRRLLRDGTDLRHLECLLLGGAPLPETLPAHLPIFPTYGMTEMSSQIATCGHVLKYREVKIGNNQEIFVRGETLFHGYAGEPPLDRTAWFPTGDYGTWDANGALHISGRRDDLIISGGKNIQPAEIETHLLALPGILDAVVVGLPDPEFGMRPVVFLNPVVPLEEICRLLAATLPRYKLPVRVFPLPEEGTTFKGGRRQFLRQWAEQQAPSGEVRESGSTATSPSRLPRG